jgi:CheY-like chemotaxis protein
MFSVTVTWGQPQATVASRGEEASVRDLEGLRVLCLDNDPMILEGMQQLLMTMGASVSIARDREQALQLLAGAPDIVLADYHLNDSDTGLAVMQAARKGMAGDTPCIVISADDSDVVRDRVRAANFRFLAKPVNPARLRALILALTRP